MEQHKEYYMHFVGSKLYGRKRFVNESKRLGVQRVIPFRMLKNITWGKPILCAEYQAVDEKYIVSQMDDLKLVTLVKKPVSTVFGYFNVDSLSYSKLPDNIRAKLFLKLNVVSFVDFGTETQDEERSCGQYSIGGCATVTNTVEEIVDAIKELCEEEKIDPNEYKYFLKGEFKEFDKPLVLYGRKFSRGYSKVSIQGFDIKENQGRKEMFFLKDYERRSYLKKEDRDRLDNTILEEYLERAQ